MDSVFIAYTLSFLSITALIYLKMRKTLYEILEQKQKDIVDSLKTADYIKNFSLFSLYEETKKQDSIGDGVSDIEKKTENAISQIRKVKKDHIKELEQYFEKELSEQGKKINVHFIQEIKTIAAQRIIDRLIIKLHERKSPNDAPVREFVNRFKVVGD